METFICRIRTHVLMTIIKGLFHSPQTLNGHVQKGTGSLIQHPGVTTVKWSQIGAALTFLSNIPSLVELGDQVSLNPLEPTLLHTASSPLVRSGQSNSTLHVFPVTYSLVL